MEVHKVLCLPRNLRAEVHKVLRLPRNLHMEVHKVLRPAPDSLASSKVLRLPRNLADVRPGVVVWRRLGTGAPAQISWQAQHFAGFEVVTTMPGPEGDAEFRGGGSDGSSGVELVGVIRRVEEEPKKGVEPCRRPGRESCEK